MRAGAEEGEHPDYEEVVGYHGAHLGETDALDADSGEELLVGEGEEEFAQDFGFGAASGFREDDGEGD